MVLNKFFEIKLRNGFGSVEMGRRMNAGQNHR